MLEIVCCTKRFAECEAFHAMAEQTTGEELSSVCSSFLWSCWAKYRSSNVVTVFFKLGRKKKNGRSTGTRWRGRKMDRVKSSFTFSSSVRPCKRGDQKPWSPFCLRSLWSFILCWALGNSRTYSTCDQLDLVAGVQDIYFFITLKSVLNIDWLKKKSPILS